MMWLHNPSVYYRGYKVALIVTCFSIDIVSYFSIDILRILVQIYSIDTYSRTFVIKFDFDT